MVRTPSDYGALQALWEALFTRLCLKLSRLLRFRADPISTVEAVPLGTLFAFEFWHDGYLNSPG
jgi:hypothetical protein